MPDPRQNCKDLTRDEISALRKESFTLINGIKTTSLVCGTSSTRINFCLEHEIQRAQKCRLISKEV